MTPDEQIVRNLKIATVAAIFAVACEVIVLALTIYRAFVR